MRRAIAAISVATLMALWLTDSAFAQRWYTGKTSVGQVALDYSRDPAGADQKYRNVELQFPQVAVTGAPAKFPSGRTYLPVLGLGGRPVHAIFPADEIPPDMRKGVEISMTCTAQGLYTLQGSATFSPDEGFLTLACNGLRVVSTTFAERPDKR